MSSSKEEFIQFLVQNPKNQKVKIFNYCKYSKEFIVDSINWPSVFCKYNCFKKNNAHLF